MRRCKRFSEIAAKEAAECVVICAQLEAELVALPPEERLEYLKSLGVTSSGVDQLIKSAYHLLGLMSFLTAGEKEVRAWTIPQGTRAQTPPARFIPTSSAVSFAPRLSAMTTCCAPAHMRPRANRD